MSPGQILLLARAAVDRSKDRHKRPGRLSMLARMIPSVSGETKGRERVEITLDDG